MRHTTPVSPPAPAPPPEPVLLAEPAPPPEPAVLAELALLPEPAVLAELAPPPEPAVLAELAPLPEPAPPPEPAPAQLGSVSSMLEGVNEASEVVEKWNVNDEPGPTDTLEVLEYVQVDPDCVWVQPAS
ncbi:hypothetical protein WME75_00630 [Sorangium sp. So ce1014]|uniref:hypothetical protein n=1 Tax=Sorangium sp. So ce1014 TaxID=3133326 RepID=UPI003F6200D0